MPQGDLYYYLSQVGGFENLLDLGYDSSTLKGRYMLYGAMKRKLSEISRLDKSQYSLHITSIGNNPVDLPQPMTVEMSSLAVLSQGRDDLYQLKPQESLMDVAKKHDMKLSTLLKLNDIDPSLPPQQSRRIRLR